MAVIKRRVKKTDLSHLTSGVSRLAARDLLDEANRKGIETVPLDIERLIKSFGIKVKIVPMDDEVSGHLALSDGVWEIAVNALHHPKLQRFTLAHELGHYVLHRWECQRFEDTKLFRNNESNPMEVQANAYAADLLMPEREFKDYIRNTSKNIDRIADHFKVSAYAVRVRAKNLGFSGHGL
jgi:Zn-dependent peptidase ImmA (M78 family)